jgi:hypothetical protein
MRDEMIPVKKHQIWFLAGGRGVERELLALLRLISLEKMKFSGRIPIEA